MSIIFIKYSKKNLFYFHVYFANNINFFICFIILYLIIFLIPNIITSKYIISYVILSKTNRHNELIRYFILLPFNLLHVQILNRALLIAYTFKSEILIKYRYFNV